MKKKLLLTYPNQKWLKCDLVTTWKNPPGTLCLLGAMVKNIVDVKIIDTNFYDLSKEEFRAEVKNYAPDYVGISVLTSEYADILDVAADIVKNIDKSILTIAGGVHVTTNYLNVMRNMDIDYACRGEGENLLRELLLHLMGKRELPKKGLIYRDAEKNIRVQDQVWFEDLTKLPLPDYSLVNFEDYIWKQARVGPSGFPELPGTYIQATRGCPSQCSFCQVNVISGLKIRCREPKDVISELIFLKKNYGLKSFVFIDDNLFLTGKKAKHLLREMIKSKLDLRWQCGSVALNALDEEMVDLMKQSGCEVVGVAIESGCERVLREIVRKRIQKLKEIPQLIKMIKSRGITVRASFIIGFPGETWEEIRETIRFAEICNADYVKIFAAVPLRGTQLWDMAISSNAMNLDSDKFSVEWRYSQIKSDEWTSKDISILRVYEWDRINFSPDRIKAVAKMWGCSIEELSEIRKKTRDSLEFPM